MQTINKDSFTLVQWPDIQYLMHLHGFRKNAYLVNDEEGMEQFGSSAYFVRTDWLEKNTSCKADIVADIKKALSSFRGQRVVINKDYTFPGDGADQPGFEALESVDDKGATYRREYFSLIWIPTALNFDSHCKEDDLLIHLLTPDTMNMDRVIILHPDGTADMKIIDRAERERTFIKVDIPQEEFALLLKVIKSKQLDETKKLQSDAKVFYNDIDRCITDLIKARTSHNETAERKALSTMEGIMVGVQQELTCLNDYFKRQLQNN